MSFIDSNSIAVIAEFKFYFDISFISIGSICVLHGVMIISFTCIGIMWSTFTPIVYLKVKTSQDLYGAISNAVSYYPYARIINMFRLSVKTVCIRLCYLGTSPS